MEINYKRTYTPTRGRRYTVGEIKGLLGCAMEIAAPDVKMEEDRLAPGEICMMLMGITPEEYALKDENPKALDALAAKLAKTVPADRLLGWRVLNLKGETLKKTVKPKAGESIDGGEYARRVQDKLREASAGPIDAQLMECKKLQMMCVDPDTPEGVKQDWKAARSALAEALLGLDRIYVAQDALLKGRMPSVGLDARLEIFTVKARGERACKMMEEIHKAEVWSLRELEKADVPAFLRGCLRDGMSLLRVDNGFAAAELLITDLSREEAQPGALLRACMIREIQYGIRWQKMKACGVEEIRQRKVLEGMLTMRSNAWRALGNEKLYAVCANGRRDNCAVLRMQDNLPLLAVFTLEARARAFVQKQDKKLNFKPVQMDFDAIAAAAARTDGLVLDAGDITYRVLKTDFDKVRDLRGKPPVMVRMQAPQEQPKPAPEPEKGEAMGSLPNPDDFAPVKKREAPAEAQMEKASAEASEVKKKGLLGRIFKK